MEYKKPEDIRMENGRSLSDCMPGNLGGVVVRPATITGRIIGQERQSPRINVKNADGSGTVVDLPLSALSGPAYKKILRRVTDEIPGVDIESVRERGARVLEEVARHIQFNDNSVVAADSIPAPTDDEEENEILHSLQQSIAEDSRQAAPPVAAVDRAYSPLAALGMGTKRSKPVVYVEEPPETGKTIGPPTNLVYFEKEGIGTVPCFFHSVVTALEPAEDGSDNKTGFLVLIYDLRYHQNAARWFPPSFDPYGRPWAVKIKNDVHVYLVNTTGFQYVYDDREHCVLSVERAVIGAEI